MWLQPECTVQIHNEGFYHVENLNGTNFIQPEHVVLMQYTGLTDKNGKEIYEGDIVKVNNDYAKVFQVPDVCEIQFYCGCFNLGDTLKPIQYFVRAEDTSKSFLEIIGNIYELPDLLKTN